MSKTFNNLRSTGEERTSKYTMALKGDEKSNVADGKVSVNESRITLDKQTFLFVLCGGLLIGLMSLTLSFKAFAHIQDKNEVVRKLATIVVKQDEKIKSIHSSLERFDSYQTNELRDIKKSISTIDRVVNKSERTVSELAIDSNLLRIVIDDLKNSDQNLEEKYTDLSDELKVLKQLQVEIVE